jgi:hypothetical protein
VAVATDPCVIAGCTLNVLGAPVPCVTVRWPAPATRVLIDGRPALLLTSGALGVPAQQAPPWPLVVTSAQTRVVGT